MRNRLIKYNYIYHNTRNAVNKYHFLRFITFILVFVYLSFLITHFSSLTSAYASGPAIRVSPVIINISLSPGKTTTHEIVVENLTDAPMPLRASLNDFLTTGEEGGYMFENTKTNPLLSWIKLSDTDVILSPKEKKKITMTITTPRTIPFGGYYGILFFEPVTQAVIQDTRVSTKVGILMLANIGVTDSNAKKAEIESFDTDLLHQDGNLSLLLRVKNISLNFFTAKPILRLKPLISLANNTLTPIYLEEKILFPGKIRRWDSKDIAENLPPNIYKASMQISTGNGQYVNEEKYFVVFPILYTAGAIIVLFFVIYICVRRKRIKKVIQALFTS